jgi:phage terminase large subunit GpA-like protein
MGFFPTKGFNLIKKRRDEKADDDIHPSFRRYRAVNVGNDTPLVEVNTAHYKNIIYANLKIPRQDGASQKPGFCDFPTDYGAAYFEMLTAEEKRRDGSFYCPSGRRNEALDVRVLNLCCADMYLHEAVLALQANAKARGVAPDRIGQINSKTALEEMAKGVASASSGGRQ